MPELASEHKLDSRSGQILWGSLATRLVGCLLLLIALKRMPYSYYTFLRLYLVLAVGYAAVIAHRAGKIQWAWVLGITAFIYNPIVPMRFGRDGWTAINLLTIPVVVASCYFVCRDEAQALRANQ